MNIKSKYYIVGNDRTIKSIGFTKYPTDEIIKLFMKEYNLKYVMVETAYVLEPEKISTLISAKMDKFTTTNLTLSYDNVCLLLSTEAYKRLMDEEKLILDKDIKYHGVQVYIVNMKGIHIFVQEVDQHG